MKKIAIALCAIVLVIVAGILPAFAEALPLPTFPNQNTTLTSVTYQDADYLVSIVSTMKSVGALNSLRPILVTRLTATGAIVLYCCSPFYSPSVDLTSEEIEFSIGVYQFMLTSGGFSFATYLSPGVTVLSANVIAKFEGSNSTPTINESYAFSSGSANSAVVSIRNYWLDFLARLNNDPSEGLQQAYDEGLRVGYDNGKADGYDEGFFWGKDEGFNDGYYQATEASKPLIDRAYDEGYAEGEAEGYLAGRRDQALEQSAMLDIPAIFDGMFNGVRDILGAFEIEIFGISIVGMLIAFVVIAVVAFVVRKLWK